MDTITFFMIFSTSLMGAWMPGPDILFILRNTLLYGAKYGFACWFGVFLSTSFYLTIVYLGLAHFLQETIIQIIIGVCGASYLLYHSVIFFIKPANKVNLKLNEGQKKPPLYLLMLKGFMINISNPKFIIFVTSFVAPFIGKQLEAGILVFALGSIIAFWTVIFVAAYFRKLITNNLFDKIDRICAILFGIFAILLFYHSFELWMGMDQP